MKIFALFVLAALGFSASGFAQNNPAMENIAKETRFLEQNKQREGVKVTPSGLQYQVVKEGSGKAPGPTDTVTVHYEGKLINGTVFDSSYQRGQPISFPLNRVIPGWTEGLQLMKPGAKYMLYIPSKLGYGVEGHPPTIGPNECLIFTVELISVK